MLWSVLAVAAKPVYTTGTTYNPAQRTAVAVSKIQPVQASSASTYVYPTQTTQPATTYTTTSYIPAAATTTATNTYTSKGKTQCSDCQKVVLTRFFFFNHYY